MAVTVDVASVSAIVEASAGPITWSHTVSAGANRLLAIVVAWSGFAFEQNVSSVTFGAAGLTSAGTKAMNTTSAWNQSQIWYLVAPTVRTDTITVNFSDNGVYGFAGGLSCFGVNQAAPVGTLVTATGATTPASLVVVGAAGDLIIDVLQAYLDPSLTPSGAQTQRWNVNSPGNCRGAGSTAAGGASVTMSWTEGANQPWAQSGIAIKSAVTAVTAPMFRGS